MSRRYHRDLAACRSLIVFLRRFASFGLFGVLFLGLPAPASAQTPGGVVWAARDLASDGWLGRERADRLEAPIAPGSVYKLVAIAAALESGVLTANTGIACTRTMTGATGMVPPCSHTDLHRPLRAADALSQSCNVFVTTVARRLSRAAFDKTLRDLQLPPSDPARPLTTVALGLDGVAVSPAALLEMIARLTAEPSPLPWKATTRAVIRGGLEAAARTGTAAVLATRGVDALAKTGTTVVGGRPQGVVVGVARRPESSRRVAFVLIAPGATGADAASLAAERLVAIPAETAPAPGGIDVGSPGGDSGYAIRRIPLEEYIAGVVAGEAAPGSSSAALEALAIVARTFAQANRYRHRDDGFDLCTLTHCQVLRSATPATIAAAAATRGQVLMAAAGRPAPVYLSAACGGHTARPSEVWPSAPDPAHLPARVDDACAGVAGWQTDVRAADVMRALRAGGLHGDQLRGLRILARTSSGRARLIGLDGFVPRELPAETFRSIIGRSLGWNVVKSTQFDVSPTASGFRFAGRGAGHGVGLCVIGSVARAARGETVAEILGHYFPGLTVASRTPDAPSPAAEVVVVVPDESRREEARVRSLTARLRDGLARELEVIVPRTLTLRFHPTVESYQRATGRQWFTAAATTGPGEAHFIPLSTLVERGTLETTIRHELVHLLTADVYKNRPMWVQEGAAVYYATPSVERSRLLPSSNSGASATMICPTDGEIRRAMTGEALRDIYRRSTACFARAMIEARSWTRVGR